MDAGDKNRLCGRSTVCYSLGNPVAPVTSRHNKAAPHHSFATFKVLSEAHLGRHD